MAQSRCNCSDDKSTLVIQDMTLTLPGCSHTGRRKQACAYFRFPISRWNDRAYRAFDWKSNLVKRCYFRVTV